MSTVVAYPIDANGARQTVRDSRGVPYVITKDSGTTISVRRGVWQGAWYVGGSSYTLYSGGSAQRMSQSFQGDDVKLTSVFFRIAVAGSPTGNVYVRLCSHSGTYGTSSVPGTTLTTITKDIGDLQTELGGASTYKWYEFKFSTPYQLSSGTNYVISIEYDEGGSSGNSLNVDFGTAGDHDGNWAYYNGSSWSANSSWDMHFFLKTEEDIISTWKNIGTSYSSGTAIEGVSCAIDSSDILHISWLDDAGKASPLMYGTADLRDDEPSISNTVIISDIGEDPVGGDLYTAIAIDSGNVPHIAYTEIGRKGNPCMYTNKVGGSWNTPVTVYSVESTYVFGISIAISLDNVPIVSFRYDNGSYYYQNINIGTANNSSLFSSGSLTGYISYDIIPDFAVLYNGDIIAVSVDTNYNLQSTNRSYGDSWSTYTQGTSSSSVVSSNSKTRLSTVANGTNVYVFYINNSDEICYDIYDTVGDTWAGETVLDDTGTFTDVRAKWGFWVDNDSQGALTNYSYGYVDGSDLSPYDPDSVWTNESNLIDGSTSTYASCSTEGDFDTNYLDVDGTNFTTVPDNIMRVELGIGKITNDPTYYELNTPSGGWTLSALQGLSFRLYTIPMLETLTVYVFEDGVREASGTELDSFEFTGFSNDINGIYLRILYRKTPNELDFVYTDDTNTYFDTLAISNATIHNASVAMSGAGNTTIVAKTIVTHKASTTMDGVGGTTIAAVVNTTHKASLQADGAGTLSIVGTTESTGIVSVWELDETSGNLVDVVSGHTATASNLTYDQSGKVNSAIEFDGSTSAASVPYTSDHEFDGTSDFTFGCWVYVDGSVNAVQPFVGKPVSDGSHNDPYWEWSLHAISITSSTMTVRLWRTQSGTDAGITKTGVSTNEWHHFIGRYVASTSRFEIWIDGAYYSYIATTSFTNYSQPFLFGRNGNSTEMLDGYLDQVFIANKALSSEEITTIYNDGNGLPYTYWSDPNGVYGSISLGGLGNLTASATTYTIHKGQVALDGAGTSTITAKVLAILKAQATLDGAGSLVATSSLTKLGTLAIDGIGTVSIVGIVGTLHTASVSLDGVGSLVTNATKELTGLSYFSGLGALNVSALREVNTTLGLNGIGTLSATAATIGIIEASVSFSGNGLTAISGQITRYASTTINGIGTATISAKIESLVKASVQFDTTGDLTQTSEIIRLANTTLNGNGVLTTNAILASSLSGSAYLNGAGSLVVNALKEITNSVILNGSGALSINYVKETLAQSTINGTGLVTISGIRTTTATVSFSGVGNSTINTSVTYNASLALNGVGTADIIGNTDSQVYRTGSAILNGVGGLTIGGTVERTANSSLQGLGDLSIIPVKERTASVSFSATGGLTASAGTGSTITASVLFEGDGYIVPTGIREITTSVSHTTSGDMTTSGIRELNANASLVGSGELIVNYASSSIIYVQPSLNGNGYVNIAATLYIIETEQISVEDMENIEYLSFNNEIIIDATNQTGRATAGTNYPTGTAKVPVNNIVDAVSIASTRFIDTIRVIGSLTIADEVVISNMKFTSFDKSNHTIILATNSSLTNCVFSNITVSGYFQGNCTANKCIVNDITLVTGVIYDSILDGTILLSTTGNYGIIGCSTTVNETVVIDMNGSGQSLKLSNFNGTVRLTNKTGNESVYIDMASGQIEFTKSVTSGTIYCRGIGQITRDLSKGALIYDALIDTSGKVKPPSGLPRTTIIN